MNCRTSLGLLIVVGIARTGVPLRAECATLPLDQQFERSSVVFVGRALSQAVITSVVPRETETTFQVEQLWKGKWDSDNRLRVRTCGGVLADEDLWCGEAFRFRLGSRYVVLAEGKPPKATTCDHTASVADAEETLRWLSTKRQDPAADPIPVRLDRSVKEICPGCELSRLVYALRQDTGDLYEWNDPIGKGARISIEVRRFSDASEAHEYVRDLKISAPNGRLEGIGDAALVASMDGRGPTTVHMSVGEYYVQLSTGSHESAVALAKKVAAAMYQQSATVVLQPALSLSDGVRARLDRMIKDTGDRWTLQRAVRFSAVPGVRDEVEIYEWRDTNDGNKRILVSIYHYNDAAEARKHVEHLGLVIETAAIPVDAIGDRAKVATMRPGDPFAPGTLHFSVDWMYVQLSAPTVELATKLAREIAEELRIGVNR